MADYVKSIGDVPEVRNADREKELSDLEMKEYRKVTGKVSWLANSTQPDFALLPCLCQRTIRERILGIFEM